MSQISGLHLEQLYVTWTVCSLQVSLWYKNTLDRKNPDSFGSFSYGAFLFGMLTHIHSPKQLRKY